MKLQRQLAHKEKRSQNYYKTKKKIALCHEKITNTRKDYLHKMSHEIISENQVIVSEDLQIKAKKELIKAGENADALAYELADMEKAINGDPSCMHLDYTKDVMDMMTEFRKSWGFTYPEEEK